jgi:hypothetical protein
MILGRTPLKPRVLSFGQERLWYLHQLAPSSAVYNVPFRLRLQGSLDTAAFEKALDALVDRHQVLRTVYLAFQSFPGAFPFKQRPAGLKQIDLRHLPEPERETEAGRRAHEEGSRPFDLARDLMFRPFLFRLRDDEHLFFYVVHHIAIDAVSVRVLYRDLSSLYNAFVSGSPVQLPELPGQYADFASWQQSSLDERRLDSLKDYWRQNLVGAPMLDLPLDFPRPAMHSGRGKRLFFALPPKLVSAANDFSRSAGTTPYRGFYAAFNVFLHCHSGLADLCVGSPCLPRFRGAENLGIQNLIGFFANTIVLRTDLSSDPTFRQIIKRVDGVIHGALAHSDLPFHKIVDAVQPPRDPSRTSLFQVNFRAVTPPDRLQLSGITASLPEYLDNGTSKFDLALEIDASAGKTCYFEYCSDLFQEQTVRQMENDYENLLRALIAEPDTPLSDVRAVAEISRRARLNSHEACAGE